MCQGLFFNKVKGSATLLKKRLWHRCFPVNLVKFLRTPFYIEHLWWLLLKTRKVFMQKQPSKGFFKKGVMRNLVEFARKHFPESPFFIKVNSVAFLNTRP